MRVKHLIGLTALALVVAPALPAGAGAASGAPTASAAWMYKWHRECVRFDLDDPIYCNILIHGPSGPRGLPGGAGADGESGTNGTNGTNGLDGAIGPIGPIGLQGPVGARGATGVKGITGDTGIQGIQGNNGAFIAGGPADHLVLVTGTKIGPIPSASGPMTGTELTPSVARCPLAGPDKEAYDGGVTVITTGTNDVVNIESSYPGLYINQTQVDPLPVGAPPGAISDQAANAYLAQAVIGDLKTNDQVTVQAYVLCGP